MVQPIRKCSVTHFMESFDAQLVELERLRHHEEPDPNHLRELKEEIRSDRILKLAIAVDVNTRIILDGEHRFNALKELGCKRIPVVFVDYASPDIKVHAWRRGVQLTKKDVIEAGCSRQKFPPMTTKHMVQICNGLRHISIIEEKVNVPLEKLRSDWNDCS